MTNHQPAPESALTDEEITSVYFAVLMNKDGELGDALRAVADAAVAAHVAQQVPDNWQPISTAPKDGTNVLLVNRAKNMATGLWNGLGGDEGWWLRGGNSPNSFFNGGYGPTHWMLLPAPPQGV
jgi:hypothetical protein